MTVVHETTVANDTTVHEVTGPIGVSRRPVDESVVALGDEHGRGTESLCVGECR